MRFGSVILAAALFAAHGAPAADLDPAKLDQARSLVAEGAALVHARSAGRVTEAYAHALRGDIRDGLEKLAKDPAFAPVAGEALDALARADETRLAALRDRLVAVERRHGRAG